MSTVIRSEISKKNPYYISKHRHLELKHFCLQYREWVKALNYLNAMDIPSIKMSEVKNSNHSNITASLAVKRIYLENCINMVTRTAAQADSELGDYILKAVTEDRSFNYLKMKLDIPCGKDMYYDRYRRFFWLLSSTRN